jgi:hypothetical protein
MATKKRSGRETPVVPKAGVTKNRSRKYENGGRTYKCGGKLKK